MEWVGLLVSVLFSLAAFIRSYSEDLGGRREWRQNVDNALKKYDAHYHEYIQHTRDTEVHWTTREREAVSKQLDRIEELIQELLAPRTRWTRDNDHPD